MSEKLNELVFWRQVISALKEQKYNYMKNVKSIYGQKYFESFKNNEFTDYGKIYMSLEKAEKEYQKLSDLLENELEK